ncbi:hypothetical protein I633_22836 (plasmid) [Alteromonas mediterranea 615]|uniref:Uncharacterized protein n=1 Tax=Alteromonas mediterranea 615 TaxID=1300253 RepID=S5AIH9_9ALTE|nr:hypothetical protein I633_22836 [Alteromonas mediterranea 615]
MSSLSWRTADTDESITTEYSPRGALPAKMVWVEGGVLHTKVEYHYRGRGDFGGVNFCALIDRLNGGSGDKAKGICCLVSIEMKIKPELSNEPMQTALSFLDWFLCAGVERPVM